MALDIGPLRASQCFNAHRPSCKARVNHFTLSSAKHDVPVDRMQLHLDSCEVTVKCDWEPLERVLALRPLFFRLMVCGKCVRTSLRP